MYLFKNYALKDWMGFAEVFGMPLRVGKYEPGASRADRESLIQAVRSLVGDQTIHSLANIKLN
jgi:phage gp29-like protein